jgi:hypothetical protein
MRQSGRPNNGLLDKREGATLTNTLLTLKILVSESKDLDRFPETSEWMLAQ